MSKTTELLGICSEKRQKSTESTEQLREQYGLTGQSPEYFRSIFNKLVELDSTHPPIGSSALKGADLLLKLVSQLQGNSEPEFYTFPKPHRLSIHGSQPNEKLEKLQNETIPRPFIFERSGSGVAGFAYMAKEVATGSGITLMPDFSVDFFRDADTVALAMKNPKNNYTAYFIPQAHNYQMKMPDCGHTSDTVAFILDNGSIGVNVRSSLIRAAGQASLLTATQA